MDGTGYQFFFTPFSNVSIDNFEQVNVRWDRTSVLILNENRSYHSFKKIYLFTNNSKYWFQFIKIKTRSYHSFKKIYLFTNNSKYWFQFIKIKTMIILQYTSILQNISV